MRVARTYSTEAIPLRRMDLGESDRLVTLFTPLNGKLRVVAKGVRKSTSRMSGHLELFVRSRLMIARGRQLDIVTQAAMIEPFAEIRGDLIKTSQAYHLAELVDAFLEEHDSQPEVFSLLCDALRALSTDLAAELVVRHFELHLLDQVGFRPQLTACLGCDEPLGAEANGYSVPRGGVFCPRCAPGQYEALRIQVDTLKLLRYLQRTPGVAQLVITLPRAVAAESEQIMRAQIEFVLERKLRSADFVRRVALAGRAV